MGRVALSAPGFAGLEKAAIVLTPVIAIATVALGLRVGESSRVLGARVQASGRGSGRSGEAFQITTLAEEGGVPELVALNGLSVSATAKGTTAHWTGSSNGEGIAEAWLDLPGIAPGDRIDVSVHSSEGAELANGVVEVPPAAPEVVSTHTAVRPTRQTGAITLDVDVYGGKLVPTASTRVIVHARDATTGRALDGVRLAIDPDPGLTVAQPFAATSEGGWSEARVQADFLIVGWTVTATGGGGGETATWYGSLPVSPGAASANLPLRIDEGTALPLHLVAPPATKHLYVEVDDAEGRDFATTVDVAKGGVADVEVPPLGAGLYWLVTSSDVHGAETMNGSAIARPFRVGSPRGSELSEVTELARTTRPTRTTSTLDGLMAPKARAARARKQGLTIGLVALALATVLEVLLVLRAASRSRMKLRAVMDAAREAESDASATAPLAAATGVLVLVLVTLLGFALLAAMLVVSGR